VAIEISEVGVLAATPFVACGVVICDLRVPTTFLIGGVCGDTTTILDKLVEDSFCGVVVDDVPIAYFIVDFCGVVADDGLATTVVGVFGVVNGELGWIPAFSVGDCGVVTVDLAFVEVFDVLPGDTDTPSLVDGTFGIDISGNCFAVGVAVICTFGADSVDMIDSNLRPERIGTVVMGVAVLKPRDPT
jgi:hypothetical protein